MSFTITTRHAIGGHESESTIYVQDDRSRTESRSSQGRLADDGSVVQTYGPLMAIIRRCDLGQIFSLNLDAEDYQSSRLLTFNTRLKGLRALRYLTVPWHLWRHSRRRPTLLVETTTVDTGERKEMFGFTARRVITTTRHKPLAPPVRNESVTTTDGWYIDIDPTIACERLPPGAHSILIARQGGEPPAVPQFKDIGPRETGYPVDVTSVHTSNATLPEGTPNTLTMTHRTWVTHLSTDALDASLFEVPASFRKRP